jgi:glycosidase
MCYSFELMGYDYTPAFFRNKLKAFFDGAPQGWPMWAFSNHDVVRQASRWARHGASQDALARQAGALLISLQGSLCLWQGEELGQTDTELDFEDLVDPQVTDDAFDVIVGEIAVAAVDLQRVVGDLEGRVSDEAFGHGAPAGGVWRLAV